MTRSQDRKHLNKSATKHSVQNCWHLYGGNTIKKALCIVRTTWPRYIALLISVIYLGCYTVRDIDLVACIVLMKRARGYIPVHVEWNGTYWIFSEIHMIKPVEFYISEITISANSPSTLRLQFYPMPIIWIILYPTPPCVYIQFTSYRFELIFFYFFFHIALIISRLNEQD